MPQRITARLVLKLVFRGSVLFLLLIWFVHAKLTTTRPHETCTTKHDSFLSRLACKANITEGQVKTVLEELGPAVVSELARGNQVQLPHFGRFRVVITSSYSVWDKLGKKKVIPAAHSVEYLPADDMLKEVNRPAANPLAAIEEQGKIPAVRLVPVRFGPQNPQN